MKYKYKRIIHRDKMCAMISLGGEGRGEGGPHLFNHDEKMLRIIAFQQESCWHPPAHWLVSRVRPETGRKNILQNIAVKVRFKI